MNFEEQLMQRVMQKILQDVKTNTFIKMNYSHARAMPDTMLDKLWDSINWEEVIEQVRPTIQTRICNSIIGAMETEIKTDIKKVLSVDGVRQRLRMEIYPKLMKILEDVHK